MKPATFLELHYEQDHPGSVDGAIWIVPARYRSSGSDRPVQLSYDCGSAGELDRVINDMIADLEEIRREAPTVFARASARRTIAQENKAGRPAPWQPSAKFAGEDEDYGDLNAPDPSA